MKMKTVWVSTKIEMLIPDNADEVLAVREVLNWMNEVIGISESDNDPNIFTTTIDASDIEVNPFLKK